MNDILTHVSADLFKWIQELEFQNKLDEKSTLGITRSELKVVSHVIVIVPNQHIYLSILCFNQTTFLKRMFSDADKDKDGYVDREEFKNLVEDFYSRLSKVINRS